MAVRHLHLSGARYRQLAVSEGIRKLRRLCAEDMVEFERKMGPPLTEEGARWRKNLLRAYESGWLQAVVTLKKKRTGGRELTAAQTKQHIASQRCLICQHVIAQHDADWENGKIAFVVCYQCDGPEDRGCHRRALST